MGTKTNEKGRKIIGENMLAEEKKTEKEREDVKKGR